MYVKIGTGEINYEHFKNLTIGNNKTDQKV